jgi:hypothetical protein
MVLNQSAKFDESALVLYTYGALSFLVITVFGNSLYNWHSNGIVDYIASDASKYFQHYVEFEDELTRYFVSGPALLMIVFGGKLQAVLYFNLLVLLTALNSARSVFSTSGSRLMATILLLAFPYVLVAPFSLNKEVFLLSSALLFLSYFYSGSKSCLLAAFLIAPLARYYMVFVFVFILVTFPRGDKRIRWGFIVLALFACSIVAWRIDDVEVPGYSQETVLDETSGFTALVFSELQRYGLYWLIYPVKYIVYPSLRIWSLIGSGIKTSSFNLLESIVSIFSLVFIFYSFLLLSSKHSSMLVRKLIWIGLLSPVPIMLTEVGHWRYFSFVYVFFLAAVFKAREMKKSNARIGGGTLHGASAIQAKG